MVPHLPSATDAGHASPQPNVGAAPRGSGFPATFWTLVVLTGLGSGLGAGVLMALLRFVQHAAWHYRAGSFLVAVEGAADATRVIVLAGAGLLVALVVPLLGRIASRAPSELEATIWFRDGRLPPTKTVLKAVFSIVIVGLGASLGRESAPKQMGALVGGMLAHWRGIEGSQRRLLAACGAGAGIAAVYDVPFGGALFALEVLLGSLALPLVAPAFLAALTATAASWVLLPDEPTYQVPSMPLTAGLMVWAVVAAPVAGVASALFVRSVAAVAALKPPRRAKPPIALAVFTALGLLAIPYPQLLGNGKDAVELAALDRLAPPTLMALLVLKPLATAACLGTGAPGGLFTPTITFGALLGGALGHLWGLVWPDAPAGAYALVGAAAVLAATTKGPVSALALMLELTRHVDGLLVPMLLAIAGAVSVAHRLDPRSTYTCRLADQAGILKESDVSAATRYDDLLRLSLANDKPLIVLDERGGRLGTLTRADLVAAATRLAPHEIATAIDVLEVKGAGRSSGHRSPRT